MPVPVDVDDEADESRRGFNPLELVDDVSDDE